jgi:hypothetical protein
MPFSFEPILSLLPSFFRPKRLPMPLHPFDLLLAGNLDTEAAATFLWSGVQQSTSPLTEIHNYPLTQVALWKTEIAASEHEFLIINATNILAAQNNEFQQVLDRTVSSDLAPAADTVDQFYNHPESGELLDSIKAAIRNATPVLAASAAVGAAVLAATQPSTPAAVLTIPLSYSASSLAMSGKLPHIYLLNDGPSPPILPQFHPKFTVPQYSLIDHVSISSAQVLEEMSQTRAGRFVSSAANFQIPPRDTRAQDRFVGGEQVVEYQNGTELDTYFPKNLKYFHIIILANVVHREYPLYALFLRQCYWFALTIFFAAQIIDNDLAEDPTPPDLTQNPDEDSDLVYLPVENLPVELKAPKNAGCWKGIRIHGCRRIVLARIVKKFHERLDEYTAMVFFLLSGYYRLLNF